MFDHLIYNICLEIYFYQEEDDESESGKYIHKYITAKLYS